MSKKVLNARLPEDLYYEAEFVADRESRDNITEYVHRLISEDVKRYKKENRIPLKNKLVTEKRKEELSKKV